MPYTVVLDPLKEEEEEKNLEKKTFKKLQNLFPNWKQQAIWILKGFEKKLAWVLKQLCIAFSQLWQFRRFFFLKRSLEETRINNYKRLLLKCWKADLDFHFMLDTYACVS